MGIDVRHVSSAPRGGVQAATPASRRRALLVLSVTGIAALAMIGVVEEWLVAAQEGAADDPQRAVGEIAYVLQALAAGISLSFIGLALVVVRVSWGVYRAQRFPPPGMSLAVDVSIVEGSSAVRRAYFGLAIAAVLGALAVVFPYMLWRTLSLLLSGHPT